MIRSYQGHNRWRHISITYNLVLLVALIFTSLSPVSAASERSALTPDSGPSDPKELEIFLDGLIGTQMVQGHIPGAAISVVKDGQLFFAKGYGSCNLQVSQPVSPETSLFQAASVGKVVTAAAVLQLVDQAKLDLKTDVNTYLKLFQIPRTYPQSITLANLLTHTAGFEDHITGKDASSIADLQPLGEYLGAHIPARVRPPGLLTAYSNYGFALAGYIVEQVSGMPYDQYLDQHIFQPLGMSSSTFHQPIPDNLTKELCSSYNYSGEKYSPNPFEILQDYPAGSLTTTADDMAKFMIAMLQDGSVGTQQVLSEASVQGMLSQQFTNDPNMPGMAYGFEQISINRQPILIKEGDISAFHAILALLPDKKIGMYITYNSDGGIGAGRQVLQAFFDRYFPLEKQSLTLNTLEGFLDRANQVLGTYSPTRRGYTTYEKLFSVLKVVTVTKAANDRLHIASLGGSPWTLVESTPWVFNRVDGPQIFAFRSGPEGMQMMLDTDPTEAYIKLPWYDTPTPHLIVLIICVLLFISALLQWPFRTVLRKFSHSKFDNSPSSRIDVDYTQMSTDHGDRKSNQPRQFTLSHSIQWLSVGVSILDVLFIILLIAFLIGLGSYPVIMRGVTPLLSLLFIIALASAILTIGMIIGDVLAWSRRLWTQSGRIYYTLITLAALLFTFELLYWNMLVFRV